MEKNGAKEEGNSLRKKPEFLTLKDGNLQEES